MEILAREYNGAPNAVLITTADLRAMALAWPCSGLHGAIDAGMSVSFHFTSNGDLVDVCWYDGYGVDAAEPEGIDGPCLVALSQDAQKALAADSAAR